MSATVSIHNLFENVRYLRKKFGMTQEEMAVLLKIDVKTLRLLENGILSDSLGLSFLETICCEFQIPFVDLFRPLQEQ